MFGLRPLTRLSAILLTYRTKSDRQRMTERAIVLLRHPILTHFRYILPFWRSRTLRSFCAFAGTHTQTDTHGQRCYCIIDTHWHRAFFPRLERCLTDICRTSAASIWPVRYRPGSPCIQSVSLRFQSIFSRSTYRVGRALYTSHVETGCVNVCNKGKR